jgi:phosphoribosyl 1,2-cyclic phosphate phosphodiesterase
VDGPSFTFLGTGTSVGIPVIGCPCAVCASDNPKNRRLRASALVRTDETTLLVDAGPDLRTQALREGLAAVDAVLFTHQHLDHVMGFDELRAFCWRRHDALPLLGPGSCLAMLESMFGWAFEEQNGNAAKGYVRARAVPVTNPFRHDDLLVTPLPVEHASVETLGYLFESPHTRPLAYLPDVKRIPSDTLRKLRGVELLVIDALRPAPHPTHQSTEEALAVIRAIGPGETWLTHLSHENDHEALQATLPSGVRVAWDGLRLDLAG